MSDLLFWFSSLSLSLPSTLGTDPWFLKKVKDGSEELANPLLLSFLANDFLVDGANKLPMLIENSLNALVRSAVLSDNSFDMLLKFPMAPSSSES